MPVIGDGLNRARETAGRRGAGDTEAVHADRSVSGRAGVHRALQRLADAQAAEQETIKVDGWSYVGESQGLMSLGYACTRTHDGNG